MSQWQWGTSRSEEASVTGVGLFVARPRPLEVVHIHGHSADLLLDGQPIAVNLTDDEAARGFADDVRRLAPLQIDGNFYRSLPDVHTRIEYLSGWVQRGKVYGRVLWHDLPGGDAVITVAVDGGFSLYPVWTQSVAAA